MEKVKIALIGYGNRGRLYSSFIKDKFNYEVSPTEVGKYIY